MKLLKYIVKQRSLQSKTQTRTQAKEHSQIRTQQAELRTAKKEKD